MYSEIYVPLKYYLPWQFIDPEFPWQWTGRNYVSRQEKAKLVLLCFILLIPIIHGQHSGRLLQFRTIFQSPHFYQLLRHCAVGIHFLLFVLFPFLFYFIIWGFIYRKNVI